MVPMHLTNNTNGYNNTATGANALAFSHGWQKQHG